MVFNTEGEREAHKSFNTIFYLSLLRSSEHSVGLFLLYRLDKKYILSELLDIKDLIFQFSVVNVVS